MSTQSFSYDATGVPLTTVEKTTTGGSIRYKAIVDLQGLEPVRTPTLEESARGISSLAPVTVSARSTNDLTRLAVSATCTAIDETEGEVYSGFKLAIISFVVSFGVQQALRGLGEDV